MFTIPVLLTIAVGSAISAAITNLVNRNMAVGKIRAAYDDGHEAGFKKALGLDAGKRDDAPGGFL